VQNPKVKSHNGEAILDPTGPLVVADRDILIAPRVDLQGMGSTRARVKGMRGSRGRCSEAGTGMRERKYTPMALVSEHGVGEAVVGVERNAVRV